MVPEFHNFPPKKEVKEAKKGPGKKAAAAAPAAPAEESEIQLYKGDNINGLEIMANGTPEVFPLRGHPTSIPSTWARTTTDAAMVKEDPVP